MIESEKTLVGFVKVFLCVSVVILCMRYMGFSLIITFLNPNSQIRS